jgi:putative phage-type endonuclease
MCKSKAEGGERCRHWYQERVEAKERAFEKANVKVVEQIITVHELEISTKEQIKELKQQLFFTNVARDQERISNKIRRTNQKLKNSKELLRELKDRSGDAAEALEEANENLDLVNDVSHIYESDKLGNATLVGQFGSDSQDWHDQRSRGYGGSDIGAILRIPGAKTSYDNLFKLKTGEVVSTPGSSGAAKVGHQFEPVIFRKFAKNHPEMKVLVSNGSWVHKDRPYQLANVDGLICENGSTVPNAILEIKTSSNPNDWKDKVTGEPAVPKYYRAQLLWYMSTFGIKKGYLAAIINHKDYMEFEVTAEQGELGNIHKKVQEFRDSVNAYNKVAA